ncbi:MAG TPA: AraC family transcriptional regulator, partial [Bacillales bacterium]|nr:AraC family transcriptional regulator [Bacillales bacterium]
KAEKRLLEVIKDGDPGGTLSALEFYMHELQGNPDSAPKRVGSLLWMTVKMAEEMGLILQINESLPEGTPFSQIKEWTQVQVMIAVEEFRKVHTERASGFLRKAQVYIDKHFGAAVSLEDVAEHVGLSAYYFSKLFKEQSGTTFIDYLTEVRIRRGKQLLQETRMSLKEICYEVGYRDPNYFSRVFKKITGRTPSDYRSSIQG